jgi:hypothetical protein
MAFARYEQGEGTVDVADSQATNERVVSSFDHSEGQSGALLGQTLYRLREKARESGGDSYAGASCDTVPKRAQLIDGLLAVSKDEAGAAREQVAIHSGRYTASAAGQERHAKRLLERTHSPAQGWLGETDLLGGAKDAPMVENGQEFLEVAYIHAQ